jgi:hypothetical protein
MSSVGKEEEGKPELQNGGLSEGMAGTDAGEPFPNVRPSGATGAATGRAVDSDGIRVSICDPSAGATPVRFAAVVLPVRCDDRDMFPA